jgi:hypothetical protein
MDMEMNDDLGTTIDRLTAAAGLLEQTVERLEEKLAAAEQSIAELQARATAPAPRAEAGARKTLPTATATLLAKQGVSLDATSLETGTLDAALASLSLEQRFAVKAQLLRAGLLG